MKVDCLIVDDKEALSESTCKYFNMFDVKTAWVADTQDFGVRAGERVI
ncbi:MAG: hypothetical protein FWG31_08580 [Oscillospiraceae bacterium]|nr:hypothetical protein [Oscillospiraceae bacterium]